LAGRRSSGCRERSAALAQARPDKARPAGKYSDTRPGKYSGAGFGDVCRAPPRGVDPLAAREDSTITAACRQEVIRGPSAKTLFQPLPSPGAGPSKLI